MHDIADHIGFLRTAELQFRLASAVRLAATMQKQPLDVPIEWVYGIHTLTYAEVVLREDQADFAAWSLHRGATFLMAVAMKDAIGFAIRDPKSHANDDIRNSYQVSRLIRNAFAHSPFDPIWSVDPDCKDRIFAVRDIVELNTADIHNKPFNWRQYGGPLALLRLSQFVRRDILGDTTPASTVLPLPKEMYYQQGDLILRRVRENPDSDQ